MACSRDTLRFVASVGAALGGGGLHRRRRTAERVRAASWFPACDACRFRRDVTRRNLGRERLIGLFSSAARRRRARPGCRRGPADVITVNKVAPRHDTRLGFRGLPAPAAPLRRRSLAVLVVNNLARAPSAVAHAEDDVGKVADVLRGSALPPRSHHHVAREEPPACAARSSPERSDRALPDIVLVVTTPATRRRPCTSSHPLPFAELEPWFSARPRPSLAMSTHAARSFDRVTGVPALFPSNQQPLRAGGVPTSAPPARMPTSPISSAARFSPPPRSVALAPPTSTPTDGPLAESYAYAYSHLAGTAPPCTVPSTPRFVTSQVARGDPDHASPFGTARGASVSSGWLSDRAATRGLVVSEPPRGRAASPSPGRYFVRPRADSPRGCVDARGSGSGRRQRLARVATPLVPGGGVVAVSPRGGMSYHTRCSATHGASGDLPAASPTCARCPSRAPGWCAVSTANGR